MRLSILSVAAVMALLPNAVRAEPEILGTGAAFAAPLYSKWSEDYKASSGVQVNYQATGSGVGQKQVVVGTVDFGASDVPMEASKLQESNLLQFPTAVGGLDVIVNLPNVSVNALHLTGPVLADIYMGKITKWDDPQITRLNPDLSLPSIPIIPVHHASASGMTFAISRYLSKVSPDWKTSMGIGLTLEWPSGVGVHGSAGASGEVPKFVGAIGYAESSYVTSNHLVSVQIMNKAGKYVSPTAETFAASAQQADWAASQNFAVDLTDMPGDQSWPIVTATFVLVPKNPAKVGASEGVLKFFGWAYDNGDDDVRQLQYVPLPKTVKEEIRSKWKK